MSYSYFYVLCQQTSKFFSYLPLQKQNHKKITKQKFEKRASVTTSQAIWPHYRKVVEFTEYFINPDYLLAGPEFDYLDFRQYNKIFTMGGFWKKVIYLFVMELQLVVT